MYRIGVTWIAVLQHRDQTSCLDVGSHFVSSQPRQTEPVQDELPQGLAIAHLRIAGHGQIDAFAIAHQRPDIDRADEAQPEPIVSLQLSGRFRRAAPREVARRPHDDPARLSQLAGEQAGTLQPAGADRHVCPLGDQVDRRVDQGEIDSDLGIALEELRQ